MTSRDAQTFRGAVAAGVPGFGVRAKQSLLCKVAISCRYAGLEERSVIASDTITSTRAACAPQTLPRKLSGRVACDNVPALKSFYARMLLHQAIIAT